MEKYTKPSLKYSDQVNLLKTRGLIVKDQAAAERFLNKLVTIVLVRIVFLLKFPAINVTFEQIAKLYDFATKHSPVQFFTVRCLYVSFIRPFAHHRLFYLALAFGDFY